MPEETIPEMTEHQERVLLNAIRRLDALNTAIATTEDNPSPSARVQGETLDELRMLAEEQRAHVHLLKRQYGFRDY